MTTFTRRRRFGIAVNVLLASVLAPALGGLLCYLALRPELRVRYDLTRARAFTLSERTGKILDGLPDTVDVYTCFDATDFYEGRFVPGLGNVIFTIGQYTNDLLLEYQHQGQGQVNVHLLNAAFTGHIGRIKDLSSRIGEPANNLVLVECGDRRKVLRLPDLADFDEGPKAAQGYGMARLYGFRVEEALSAALLTVTEERKVKVGFVRGHGERNPGAPGVDAAGRGGYRQFAASLAGQNFDVAVLELTGELSPDSVDVLVLASPLEEIPESEVAALQRYWSQGGKLLVLLDPATPVSLDYPVLDQCLGLKRLPGVVHRKLESFLLELKPFVLDNVSYGTTSGIVKVLRDRALRTLWHDACALDTVGRSEQSRLKIEPLVWTDAESWLDLPTSSGGGNHEFDPASEVRRSRVLGYSVEDPESGGRAVVLGDSDLLDDVFIGERPGNRALGVNACDWLARREQLLSLPPQPYDELRVDLTPAEYKTILLYVVVAIPALALLGAFAVFWTRRS